MNILSSANQNVFLEQIKEDIKILQENFNNYDPKIIKDEYAFNYWILSKIYSIDEELISSYITEYNDKSIDCYVYYPELKELYLIQNKYYSNTTAVSRQEVSDFLQTPISQLLTGNYPKSKDLQEAFNQIYQDENAKIYLHFYVTNEKEYIDIKKNIESFNISKNNEIKATIIANFYTLSGIYNLYYGENYKEHKKFTYELATINKGTFASLREEYGIEGLCEAYYIITPINEIYKMLKSAEEKEYPLFEENIREFLGTGSGSVNNGIINTLKDENERRNFIYYNNGITITCEDIRTAKQQSNARILPLVNPQIVNGCQTVNSIKFVLENYSEEQIETLFSKVYLMLKALIIPNLDNPNNREFANNVVKFTNRQNAVSDKAFASNDKTFFRLQEEFEKRGVLLMVKQSDKEKFKKKYTKSQKNELLKLANEYASNVGLVLDKVDSLSVDLEKMLQIFLALKQGGFEAFSKKAQVLKKSSNVYEECSTRIHQDLTVDNMIRLYMFFKRADIDRRNSGDERTPIPYYLVGFLNKFLQEQNINYNTFFELDTEIIDSAYNFLSSLTSIYRELYENDKNIDYNKMIKQPIDSSILEQAIKILSLSKQSFPVIKS